MKPTCDYLICSSALINQIHIRKHERSMDYLCRFFFHYNQIEYLRTKPVKFLKPLDTTYKYQFLPHIYINIWWISLIG